MLFTEYICHRIYLFQNIFVSEYICHRIYLFQNIFVTEYICFRIYLFQNIFVSEWPDCSTGEGSLSVQLYRQVIKTFILFFCTQRGQTSNVLSWGLINLKVHIDDGEGNYNFNILLFQLQEFLLICNKGVNKKPHKMQVSIYWS